MRFGLIANLKRNGAEEAVKFFIAWSEKSGNELFLSDDLLGNFGDNLVTKRRSPSTDRAVDFESDAGDFPNLLKTK